MRSFLLLAAVLFLQSAFAGDIRAFPKLKLKNGREYEMVTVTDRRPDGISISHESGTARIKFEDLPDEVVKQLGGFDPVAATKARTKDDANEAAAREEIDRGLAVQGVAKQREADHKAIAEHAHPAVLQVVQATDAGVLCRIAWIEDQKQGTSAKDSFGRDITTWRTVPILTSFSEDFHLVTGISEAVDGAQLGVALVEAGTYRYTKVNGAESTVKKWSAINGAVDASGKTLLHNSKPTRPRVSWLKSVGGG